LFDCGNQLSWILVFNWLTSLYLFMNVSSWDNLKLASISHSVLLKFIDQVHLAVFGNGLICFECLLICLNPWLLIPQQMRILVGGGDVGSF
jgi:hypothetical protein